MMTETTEMESGSDASDRIQLAQLCRGFLILNEVDADHARQFLVTFLQEATSSES
jgi:hypothetical protein